MDNPCRSGDPEQLAAVKDRFPRGGAMGLLDRFCQNFVARQSKHNYICSHPDLLDRYTGLAQQFAAIDYVAPMNVLWTYHFIHGNPDVAEPIWQNFVKGSNQIMFQKVIATFFFSQVDTFFVARCARLPELLATLRWPSLWSITLERQLRWISLQYILFLSHV